MFALAALGVAFFLRRTRLGAYVSAIGDNPFGARTTGIPTRPVIVLQYLLAALIGAFAGLVLAASVNSMETRVYNSTLIYDVILVCVLGGIGLSGGRGGVVNAVIGTLLMMVSVPFKYSGMELSLIWLAGGEALLIAGLFAHERVFVRLGGLVQAAVAVYVLLAQALPYVTSHVGAQHQDLRIGLPLLARSLRGFHAENEDHEIEIAGLVFNHSSAYTAGPEGQRSIKDVTDFAGDEGWYVCENQMKYSASYAKAAREATPLSRTSYARRDVIRGFESLKEEILGIIGLVKVTV